MNQANKKIARVRRLREIEQSKLNLLAVELSEIEGRLATQMRRLMNLHHQIENASAPVAGSTVDQLDQASQWVQYTQLRANLVQQMIAKLETQRDKTLQRVVEQKSTIRGWESLIERLQADANVEMQKLESLAADDRFLSSRMVR